MGNDIGKNGPSEEPKTDPQERELKKPIRLLPTRVVVMNILVAISGVFLVSGAGLLSAPFFW